MDKVPVLLCSSGIVAARPPGIHVQLLHNSVNVSLMDPTYEHVLAADKVVVDDWIQCTHSDRVLARMNNAGLISRESIHGELGEIVTGTLPARESNAERIFWNPFGPAIEDLAIALAMYNRALELNVGTPINLVDREWEVLF